jgi:rsbT co-antagonist protein RsbR
MNTPFTTINLNEDHFIALFNQIPIPTSLYDQTGLLVAANDATRALFGSKDEGWVGQFNMVTDPQLAAVGSAEMHRRVMAGETVVVPPSPFVPQVSGGTKDSTQEYWIESIYSPLRDAQGKVTHLIAQLRDVTHEIAQNKEIATAREAIANQQAMIESISTPVIQLWEGILTMPLVGTIDSHRAMQVIESLLTMIAERQAECVIIDITGVPLVDTQVAQYIIRAAQASKLLGCEVALVGIGVEMAQTLVQLGVDLHVLNTMANLQAGIAWAFQRRGMRVVRQG